MEAELQKLLDKQRAFFRSHRTQSVDFRKAQLRKLKDTLFKDLRRSAEVTVGVELARVLGALDHALKNVDEWAKPTELPLCPLGRPLIRKQPLGKNFPSEYFACVQGEVAVSEALTLLRWDHLFCTGSPRVGRLVMAAAAKNLVPVTLELGGKNPCIVLPDADLEKVAESLIFGKWLNAGQVCLMTDYVLLTEAGAERRLAAELKKQLEKTFTAHPKKSPQFGRLINHTHFDRLQGLLNKTKGKVLYSSADPNDRADNFVGPHVVSCQPDDVLMQEELFGPVLAIVNVRDLDAAIDFVNDRERPLGVYVFSADPKNVERVLNETTSGGVTVNGCVLHATSHELPFGGVGNSGMGRCSGIYGFKTFTHEKPVMIAASKPKDGH
ncbi:Aldehyde dehydrogenase [Aphelenchoides fujianensis]|nr:Aldehyde dehydrogenase [Aphelenchoides fujianensis]